MFVHITCIKVKNSWFECIYTCRILNVLRLRNTLCMPRVRKAICKADTKCSKSLVDQFNQTWSSDVAIVHPKVQRTEFVISYDIFFL